MVDEVSPQSFQARAIQYRMRVMKALQAAQITSDPDARENYLRLAESWERIANIFDDLAEDARRMQT